MRTVLVGLIVLASAAGVAARQDVIPRARAAFEAGQRAEALALLEARLAQVPEDVDARLVYGLMLSWDGRYDAARLALEQVLSQSPTYLDARVALMNVEWWSGNLEAARAQVDAVLMQAPGNEHARLLRQRLDARTRPWFVGALVTRDVFRDSVAPWTEGGLTVGRETPAGTVMVRGSRSSRFGLNDQLVELEAYPTVRAGTYAMVSAGFGLDNRLYPRHRVAMELYQVLGRGVEVSAGIRRLKFEQATVIYMGSVTKYEGNWMVTARVSHVPDRSTGESWSYQGQLRKYVGRAGRSFVGLGVSHGFIRQEPRGVGDLQRLDADSGVGQFQIDLGGATTLQGSAGIIRQERPGRRPQWQGTFQAGFVRHF